MPVLRLSWALIGLAAIEPDTTVAIRVFQYSPRVLEVEAGTRISWHNGDEIEHTVTSGAPDSADGRFNAVLAGKGSVHRLELTQPGVYRYHCARHHFMRGEIRVTPRKTGDKS